MAILDILKKKKIEEEEESLPERRGLPEDLEQFKIPPPRIEEMPSPFKKEVPLIEQNKPFVPQDIMERAGSTSKKSQQDIDKLDLILSKLETIDARLKLLEEKMHH